MLHLADMDLSVAETVFLLRSLLLHVLVSKKEAVYCLLNGFEAYVNIIENITS